MKRRDPFARLFLTAVLGFLIVFGVSTPTLAWDWYDYACSVFPMLPYCQIDPIKDPPLPKAPEPPPPPQPMEPVDPQPGPCM